MEWYCGCKVVIHDTILCKAIKGSHLWWRKQAEGTTILYMVVTRRSSGLYIISWVCQAFGIQAFCWLNARGFCFFASRKNKKQCILSASAKLMLLLYYSRKMQVGILASKLLTHWAIFFSNLFKLLNSRPALCWKLIDTGAKRSSVLPPKIC